MRDFLSVHWTKGSCLRETNFLRYSIKNNVVAKIIKLVCCLTDRQIGTKSTAEMVADGQKDRR